MESFSALSLLETTARSSLSFLSSAMANIALARAYQQSFETHPYTTLAFTNGALNAFGDVVAQFTQKFVRFSTMIRPTCSYQSQVDKQEEKRRSTHWHYDIPRTLRFFAFGFGMGALPFRTVWLSVLCLPYILQALLSVDGTSSLKRTSLCVR